MSLEKMYFALAPNRLDVEVVLKTRPKNVLLSYALWHKKKGKLSLKSVIKSFWDVGYYPNIMLDSGAYSFRNDREDVSFLSIIRHIVNETYYNLDFVDEFNTYEDCLRNEVDLIRNKEIDYYYCSKDLEKILSDYPNLLEYIHFIECNSDYIDYIVSLDDIFNENISMDNWIVIKSFFEDAIPTFHYEESLDILQFYIDNNAKYIGLGGVAVAKKNGARLLDIINWINKCTSMCEAKGIDLHLFGCQDNRVLKMIDIKSADGASWILSAALKHNKLGMSKFDLACENIIRKEVC